MNLAKPYGDGNHRRISWRREWDVDLDALTATPADVPYNTSARVDAKLAAMVKP